MWCLIYHHVSINTITVNAHIWPSFLSYSKSKELLAVCTESLRSRSERESSIANKRIDHYWRNIGKLKDDEGVLKYLQLYTLAQYILSLSHGNTVPEHGFWINRKILDAHGYSVSEEVLLLYELVSYVCLIKIFI